MLFNNVEQIFEAARINETRTIWSFYPFFIEKLHVIFEIIDWIFFVYYTYLSVTILVLIFFKTDIIAF